MTAARRQERAAVLLAQTQGPIKAVLHGKISRLEVDDRDPEFLQKPAPDTYSALIGLTTTLGKTKGSKALIASNGCKSKAHKVGVNVTYVPNPNPPASTSASDTADAQVLLAPTGI